MNTTPKHTLLLKYSDDLEIIDTKFIIVDSEGNTIIDYINDPIFKQISNEISNIEYFDSLWYYDNGFDRLIQLINDGKITYEYLFFLCETYGFSGGRFTLLNIIELMVKKGPIPRILNLLESNMQYLIHETIDISNNNNLLQFFRAPEYHNILIQLLNYQLIKISINEFKTKYNIDISSFPAYNINEIEQYIITDNYLALLYLIKTSNLITFLYNNVELLKSTFLAHKNAWLVLYSSINLDDQYFKKLLENTNRLFKDTFTDYFYIQFD